MAIIKPFRAVRALRNKVSLVSSRSYESYEDSELNYELNFNPFSFLHIINPGFKFHKELKASQRYQLVHNRYLEFKENDILIQDDEPNLYIYKQITETHTYCGIIAANSTEDYATNVIKKHENTLNSREILFGKYLEQTGFNAEPVLLTYKDNKQIESIISKYTSQRAEYEFTTHNKKTHVLWCINSKKDIEKIQQEFSKMNAIYIADGHHRTASSYLLSENLKSKNKNHTGNEPYNFFMSFLLPESNLKIYEFNRLIKDLNGLTKEEFLIKLDTHFRIENRGNQLYKPSKKHHISMYLDGEYYSLYLRKSEYEITDALSDLDVQILYDIVLKPILGITDLRKDNRISYLHHDDGAMQLKKEVDKGIYSVAFTLYPISINQLKDIANNGLKMPPKSTYILPKLRSGLTIYEF